MSAFSSFRTIFLFAFLAVNSLTSHAQSIVLASWNGQVLTPTVASNVTAQNIIGPSVSIYNNGTNTPSKFYVGSNGAAANLSYFTLTLQPASGYNISISNISFQISGMNTAATYAVRSSIDGYVADLATGTATMNMSPYITFDSRSHALAGLNNLSGPVSLRIYKSSAGDMLHMYNVQITGAVTAATLPLHFTAFTAQKQQGKVQLSIGTTNEENTDYLLVERSSDGNSFAEIGKLPAGHSNANTYFFTDNQPNAGDNYYRIKQVDKDTRFSYSKMLKVFMESAFSLKISPNPVQGSLQISFGDWLQTADGFLTIKGLDGRTILQTQVKRNTSTAIVDVSAFTKGVYIVRIKTNAKDLSQKFIKQ